MPSRLGNLTPAFQTTTLTNTTSEIECCALVAALMSFPSEPSENITLYCSTGSGPWYEVSNRCIFHLAKPKCLLTFVYFLVPDHARRLDLHLDIEPLRFTRHRPRHFHRERYLLRVSINRSSLTGIY